MSDPLAPFRTSPLAKSPAPRAPEAVTGSRLYEAFNAKDNQRHGRLKIFSKKGGMAHAPRYSYLPDVCFDSDDYTGFILITSTMLVKVKGRNLRPVAQAILLDTCEFIQEFREDKFDMPNDKEAPFIESIQFIVSRQLEEEKENALKEKTRKDEERTLKEKA
jgi:hypothetical protein